MCWCHCSVRPLSCSLWAFFKPSFSSLTVCRTQRCVAAFQNNVQNVFSTMERYSHCFYRDSVPHENDVICIFIEPLHLMPISLDLVTVWYLNSSRASYLPVWVTCKYKNNADQDLVNHILHHDWPRVTWLQKIVPAKTKLRVQAWCWHSMTKVKN